MDIFVQMGHVIGIPDIVMKIYSIIWMASKPISQAEIQLALKEENVSLGKTVISITLKELVKTGGLVKVKKPNDRTNYYEPASSSLTEIFQLSMSKILGPAELRMKNFAEKYSDNELGQVFIDKVNELHSFLKYIINLNYPMHNSK